MNKWIPFYYIQLFIRKRKVTPSSTKYGKDRKVPTVAGRALPSALQPQLPNLLLERRSGCVQVSSSTSRRSGLFPVGLDLCVEDV